jgi:K+ transporter
MFSIWNWGRRQIRLAYEKYPVIKMSEVIKMKENLPSFPKTVVLLTSNDVKNWDGPNPILEQMFIDRYGELPFNIVLLKINRLKYPYIHKRRYEVFNIYNDKKHGSITGVKVNFGFMEEPDVEKVLTGIAQHKEVPISDNNKDWLLHVLQPMIHVNENAGLLTQIKFAIFAFLQKSSDTPMDYFHLGHDEPLSVDYLPVHLG